MSSDTFFSEHISDILGHSCLTCFLTLYHEIANVVDVTPIIRRHAGHHDHDRFATVSQLLRARPMVSIFLTFGGHLTLVRSFICHTADAAPHIIKLTRISVCMRFGSCAALPCFGVLEVGGNLKKK